MSWFSNVSASLSSLANKAKNTTSSWFGSSYSTAPSLTQSSYSTAPSLTQSSYSTAPEQNNFQSTGGKRHCSKKGKKNRPCKTKGTKEIKGKKYTKTRKRK